MSHSRRSYKKMMKRLAAATAIGILGTGWFIPDVYAAPQRDRQPEVTVWQYQFDGEEEIASERDLKALLQSSIGQPATLKDLEKQTDVVTRYLRAKGYLVAFAYIPVQDFAHGKVAITIEPGRYDQVILENKTQIHDKAILRELGDVKSGAIVDKVKLERAVFLIGDMANAEAKTALSAGSKPGTTNLTIKVMPKGKPAWGYIGADNGGYRYTGRYQYSILANQGNPRKEGDLATASLMMTGQGQTSGSFSYTTPIWDQGSRIGISYARSQYTLGGEFSALDATGTADTLSLSYQKTLMRTRNANWYGQLRFDSKRLNDGVYGDFSRKNSQNWVAGVNGDTLDNWQGGGVNTYSLMYTRGDLDIKDPWAKFFDSIPGYGHQTNGNFGKYNFNITRLQQICDRVTLYLSYARQLSTKNLDSSEKMSLGGPYGVRAYPNGEASGDQGWIGTGELRYNLPAKEGAKNTWQLITFIDAGSVQINKYPTRFDGANHRSLYGMGVGVNWSQEENWAARVHYSWKLGKEDAQSDKDRSGRVWVQLYHFF